MSRISGAKPEIDEHKADRENPHDVDDGQTGAADSLSNHESSNGGVHGVDETDIVAGQGDVDAVTTDLNDHAGSSSGVHGVGGSNVESESGAQSKADSAENSANSYTDTHENKNNPHSSSASDTDLSNHVNDGTNPHGVSTTQIGALAASDYNPEADTHSQPTATQQTTVTAGYTLPVSASGDTNSNNILLKDGNSTEITSNGTTIDIGGKVVDEIRLEAESYSGTEHAFEIRIDGTTVATVNSNTAAGGTFGPWTRTFREQELGQIDLVATTNTVNLLYAEVYQTPVPSHNHNI